MPANIPCYFAGCVLEASTYCHKCCHGYCSEHTQQHDKTLKGNGHRSVEVDNIPFCQTHKTEPAEHLCETCDRVVCDACLMQLHQNHVITNANKMRKRLSSLETSCALVQGQFTDLDKLLKSKTKTREKLVETVHGIITSLDSFKDHMCSQRDSMLEQLQKDIDIINTSRGTLMETKKLGAQAQKLAAKKDPEILKKGLSIVGKNVSTDVPNVSKLVSSDSDVIPKEWEYLAKSGIVKVLTQCQAGEKKRATGASAGADPPAPKKAKKEATITGPPGIKVNKEPAKKPRTKQEAQSLV